MLLSHLEIDIICSEFPPLIQEENGTEGDDDLDVVNDDNFEMGNLVPDNHSDSEISDVEDQIIIVIVRFRMLKIELVGDFLLSVKCQRFHSFPLL